MTRIISETSASLRKSLQGLDYFAAEGARAFEYLAVVLTQSLESGASKDRVETIQEALKAGKIYLKSEFKVLVCLEHLQAVQYSTWDLLLKLK